MTTILVDYREPGLIDILQSIVGKNVILKTIPLDIGDIQISINSPKAPSPLVIIERKTVEDLSASIKDGRYKEQKCRLKAQKRNHGSRLIYLIEGSIKLSRKYHNNERDQKAVDSALLGMTVRDQFGIIYSKDANDSAEKIMKISSKLSDYWKDMQHDICKNDDETKEYNYAETIKLKKKDNLTPTNCFLLQLAQIPSVSMGIAKCIQSKHTNWLSLINKLKKHGVDAKKYLENLKFRLSDGVKTRRVGSVASCKIIQYIGLEDHTETKDVEKFKIKIKHSVRT